MRKRELKRFQYLASSLLCLGIFIVGVRGDLDYFINPRYTLFTNLMSLVGFISLLLAALFYRYEKEPTEIEFGGYLSLVGIFISWILSKGVWLVLVVFVALVAIPPKPLLSSTANNKRSQNYWQDYKDLRFIAWRNSPTQINEVVGLLLDPTTSESAIGKKVKLSGFILETELSSNLYLARFVVSCCAVDANPSRIRIEENTTAAQEEYQQNSWIEVEGTLDLWKNGTVFEPVILAQSIRKIEEPKPIYEYLRLR